MSWVRDPALRRIWTVLRARLEERSLRAEGRVVLTGLDRAERHAVSALVGRPVTAARCTVDLAELDAVLVDRSGIGGLREVLEAVDGAPLRDRRAERTRRADDREAPFALARGLLPEAPWREEWLDGVRRSGLLTRARDGEAAVRVAAAVLARLDRAAGPGGDPPGPDAVGSRAHWSRTELAAAVAGHAHALDEGRTVTALVLRALAARRGEPPPTGPAGRRELWESVGVRVDAVSTTCLSLGLRGTDGPVAQRLALAADAGDPVHVTAWDLRRVTLGVPGRVLVCENPRVLEAVAERHGGRHAVVCTSGRPALIVLDVLRALAGADLRYHGDFDWPGIAIANRLVLDAGVRPWRMGADDYAGAVGAGSPLTGGPVEPVWDAELGAAMRHRGVGVHEEAVLAGLLDALG